MCFLGEHSGPFIEVDPKIIRYPYAPGVYYKQHWRRCGTCGRVMIAGITSGPYHVVESTDSNGTEKYHHSEPAPGRPPPWIPVSISEDEVRRIVREEIDRRSPSTSKGLSK